MFKNNEKSEEALSRTTTLDVFKCADKRETIVTILCRTTTLDVFKCDVFDVEYRIAAGRTTTLDVFKYSIVPDANLAIESNYNIGCI